jgi:hypothetical protein
VVGTFKICGTTRQRHIMRDRVRFQDTTAIYMFNIEAYQSSVTHGWRTLFSQSVGDSSHPGSSDTLIISNITRVIKSRSMRWAGHVALMCQRRGVYRVLVGKPEVKRQLGRPMHRWEDNIKMDLQEVGWEAWTGTMWLRIGTGGGLL